MVFADIHAIFFDKDGTLANSEAYLRLLAQRRSRLIDAQIPGVQEPMLMAFGIEGDRIDPSGLMALGTRHENEIAAAAYVAETGRGWIEALDIVRTAFDEADRSLPRKADETPLFPGIRETLARLANAGLTLGVLSSDSTENVVDFLKCYNLFDQMAIALGSTDQLGKPQSEFYLYACEAINVDPSQTLVVGDAQSDILMAKNGGAAGCVGVTWGWSSVIQLTEAAVQINQVEQMEVE
jgi:phosphoglycolate phosphatase